MHEIWLKKSQLNSSWHCIHICMERMKCIMPPPATFNRNLYGHVSVTIGVLDASHSIVTICVLDASHSIVTIGVLDASHSIVTICVLDAYHSIVTIGVLDASHSIVTIEVLDASHSIVTLEVLNASHSIVTLEVLNASHSIVTIHFMAEQSARSQSRGFACSRMVQFGKLVYSVVNSCLIDGLYRLLTATGRTDSFLSDWGTLSIADSKCSHRQFPVWFMDCIVCWQELFHLTVSCLIDGLYRLLIATGQLTVSGLIDGLYLLLTTTGRTDSFLSDWWTLSIAHCNRSNRHFFKNKSFISLGKLYRVPN